jgi:hypothetical protein
VFKKGDRVRLSEFDCGGINAYDVVELEHSDIPDIPLEQMLKECLG